MFQAFSEKLEDWTGKTCFWYATVFALSSVGFAILGRFKGSVSLFFALLSVFQVATILRTIELSEREVSRSKYFLNSDRTDGLCIFIRIFALFVLFQILFLRLLILVLSGEIICSIDDLQYISLFCTYYFMACTPRPGGGHLAGKWLAVAAKFLFGKRSTQGV